MTDHYDNIPSSSTQPGYKKTKLGWLPVEWEVSNVGKAFNICNSGRKPLSSHVRQQMQGVYPYYGPTKIQDFIDEYQYEGAYALIAEDGDHFLKYADKRMTQLANGQFNVNNHAHVIEGKNKKSTTEWFYWFFYHRNIFSHLTRQGAGRYKLNKAALSKLPVALPPLPEQQKIATILSTWDRAIALTRQLLQEKEAQKKGLMQRLLTGKVRVKGFEGAWKEVTMKEIAKRVITKNTELNDNVVTISAQRGFVKQEEFFSKRVASSTLSNYFLVKKGDYCYNKSYSSGYPMGAFKRLDSYDKAVVTTLYICFRLEHDKVSSDFIINYFEGGRMVKGLMKVAQEGGRAHGLLNIGIKDFFSLKLLLPAKKEQTAIAAILTQADEEIRLLREKERALQAQKKGLMQRLLTGKVRVNP
jgi:type I restriction enzyme S subunit